MSQEYDQFRELLKNGRFLEASRLAEFQYHQGNPNNPFWLTRQAAALSRAGEYQPALDVANKAILLKPTNPYAILAMAEALHGLNRIKEALSYYEGIETDPKLSSYARKGILDCLAVLKDWDQILQRIGLWELPADVGYRWKIKALEGQHRLQEAIAVCRDWLDISPDNAQGLWALTELEIKRDGLESVLSRMGKIAKIPSRPPIYKEIYASLCRRAGKPALAVKQYEKLARMEANPKIHRKQAFALAKSSREQEAIPMMEELLRLDPKDFYIHTAYIPACGRAGQLNRALRFYEELLASYPEEKPLYGRIRKVEKLLQRNNK